MPQVRVSFNLSLDGFGAGPNRSLQDPMGHGGLALHASAFATETHRGSRSADAGCSVTPHVASELATHIVPAREA